MKRSVLIALLGVFAGCAFGQSLSGNPVGSSTIMPNPVEDKAEVVFEEPVTEGLTIVIKDLTGKLVYSIRPEISGGGCTSVPLEIESLKRGIYILQVSSQSGKVKTLKFQKN